MKVHIEMFSRDIPSIRDGLEVQNIKPGYADVRGMRETVEGFIVDKMILACKEFGKFDYARGFSRSSTADISVQETLHIFSQLAETYHFNICDEDYISLNFELKLGSVLANFKEDEWKSIYEYLPCEIYLIIQEFSQKDKINILNALSSKREVLV